MTIEETVEIQWVYTPADFFDGKIERNCGDYTIEIEGGHATARMSAAFYKPGGDFRRALTEELRSYFSLWELQNRKTFEIRDGSVIHIHPDGGRDITLAVDSVVCVSEVGTPTLIVTDEHGVVRDTRREHFEALKKLVELRLRHASDPAVRRMLESYDRSLREPEKELVRLYEVGEALAEAFGGQKAAAATTLGISYSRHEALANDPRLKQGRHSGKHLGPQRDATAAELDEARKIALEMIERYLDYLERKTLHK